MSKGSGLRRGVGAEADMDDDPNRGVPRLETPLERSSAARQALGEAVRFWWVSMLRGCLALLLGIGLFFREPPSTT